MARRVRYLFFERRRSGAILVHLFPEEVHTLDVLAAELAGLLQEPERAPLAYQRLFPPAYLDPDEADAEQMYGAFAHSHLLSARLEQLVRLRVFLAEVAAGPVDPRSGRHVLELDDDARNLLLGVVNDLRLALGAVLNVSEYDEEFDDHREPGAAGGDGGDVGEGGEPGDVDAEAGAVALAASRPLYDALTVLQGELVDLLLDELPTAGEDA